MKHINYDFKMATRLDNLLARCQKCHPAFALKGGQALREREGGFKNKAGAAAAAAAAAVKCRQSPAFIDPGSHPKSSELTR